MIRSLTALLGVCAAGCNYESTFNAAAICDGVLQGDQASAPIFAAGITEAVNKALRAVTQSIGRHATAQIWVTL